MKSFTDIKPFITIKPDKLDINPESKVLKADDYLYYAKAEEIIALAEKKALAISLKAKDAYQAEKLKGYKEGKNQASIEAMEKIFYGVQQSIDYLSNIEQEMAKLVSSAMRKIVADYDQQELTLGIVKNALQVVRNQKEIKLHVAPDQLDSIKQKIHTILADYSSISFIDIISDSRLSTGDCILESEMGIVDARIEHQIKALELALSKKTQRKE